MKTLFEKYRSGRISLEEFESLSKSMDSAADSEIRSMFEQEWNDFTSDMPLSEDKKESLYPVVIGKSQRRSRYHIYISVAACLMFVFALGITLKFFDAREEIQSLSAKEVTVTAGSDGQSFVTLPDGSTVRLNARSSISYNSDFSVSDRRVRVEGEAFFDVKKDGHTKFVVSSENMEITVHGTKFNVYAYPECDFNDNLFRYHKYESYASNQPAVHAEQAGYFLAERLPLTYFSDQVTDSKELDFAASFKYNWHKRWDDVKSFLKAGVQWKANGNVGQGEYYEDPALAANGYRPRPYTEYPFMHNLSVYAEEHLTMPIAHTKLEITAGLRMENVFIKNSLYNNKTTFSPRFNAKWQLTEGLAIRGGWGITEKLPSYYILYPKQEYRDIQTYGFSHGSQTSYIYYTQPYTVVYNPELRWQRNSNSEFAIDAAFADWKISLVGFCNLTKGPYNFLDVYEPYSYDILQEPADFTMPSDPQIIVDEQTGMLYIRGAQEEYWTPMDVKVTDQTFAKSTMQNNGADVTRAGAELVVEFPEIKPVRTTFRFDAAYTYTKYLNEQIAAYYQNGWSHTYLPNRSYQYVGLYANGGSNNTVANGKMTHNLDANLTAITHIPQARLIITCRLEMSLLRRSRNISQYQGADYAYTVNESDNKATGGNIYDGNSYTAIRPVSYMDLDGNVHPFTDAEAADPAFANLILKSANAYTFARDGYGAYMSANLSITKEIGDHVSLSFFANNFTNSRPYVKSMATGVGAIFTPAFYYGLTCRLKF